jgi:hypothetical protein
MVLLLVLCACASRTGPGSAPANGAGVAPDVGQPPEGSAAAGPTVPLASSSHVLEPAEQILQRPELSAYHGWIRYLQFRARHAAERFGKDPAAVKQDEQRLSEWSQRILENPKLLSELRGVTEWAYLSPVDGSGQPFKFNIPTDYDPAKPAPISLYMHGYSGNHVEHATGMQDHPGAFEVSVLGRSRGGRYRGLSEADVLGVLDYITEHWSVDLDRVHLNGGSMGGGGTFWLGSRYPQRFASGRPVCGYASDKPVGNLLNFPIYATHSDDDWQVPVLHARGPIAKLRALGGNATLDETTGLGHAAWNYTEGSRRSEAWYVQQVRPASAAVRRLDFTALDGNAVRDYWAEIAEWGPGPVPAHFTLEAAKGNQLQVRLENIDRLRLRLAEAPLDARSALRISLEGAAQLTLPAPLPDSIVLARTNGGWSLQNEEPAPGFRMHTPGGANQLYDGEPLLIVYGTRGGAELSRALRTAAEVASHSSNASWPQPNGEKGVDGVSHNQNLYGDLAIKPDTEVTAEDVARSHLVLIGSAAQNSVVAGLASRLPVQYDTAKIDFSDGSELAAADRALGLVHYNPDAPSRLLFWVASNDVAGYAAGSLVAELLGSGLTGADCVVTRISDPTLVASRSFDSRWRWLSREASALLPGSLSGRGDLARGVASAVRRAAAADFALAALPGVQRAAAFEPGNARLVDLIAQFYFEPVSVMTLPGSELAQVVRTLAEKPELRLEPEPDLARLQPKREYKVALSSSQISPLVSLTHLAPRKYQVTDTTVGKALARYGVAAEARTPEVASLRVK